jgi:hypothetical protein
MTDGDLFSEVSGNSEDEHDFGQLSKSEIAGVAIGTTDWTTETIVTQLSKGNIQLNPGFQRRDAWEPKRKSQFIESLILQLPVPQIVLAERNDQKGTFVVLDGKQRLLCLRQFTASPDDQEFHPFKLSDLIVRSDLNGKSFADLKSELQFRADVTSLDNYGIRAVVMRNWKTERLLGHVFLRLNMGSKPLSPQELRQALHPGPFLDYSDEASIQSVAIRDILDIEKPDFRMRDVELLIRYMSFQHMLSEYRGNLKDFLDSACSYFNANWETLKPRLVVDASQLDERHAVVKSSFGPGYKYGKWVDRRFENRFNRAIFDVLLHALGSQNIYDEVRKNPAMMLAAFQDLCSTDPRFLESVERTTKSVDATRYRLHAWYKKLGEAYRVQVVLPVVGI